MKNYSDLQGIDQRLKCVIELEPVGTPEVSVIIGKTLAGGKLFKPVSYQVELDLLAPFVIELELKNKIYSGDHETAVKIVKLQIDNIDLVPRFDYLAVYRNDHNQSGPTSYIGFNGQWRLTFDRPFYQWLHQVTGQGWLLG